MDRRHGWGVYRYSDGRVYDGPHVDGLRHGRGGTFTWPTDGSVYHGDYVRGVREGRGTHTFTRRGDGVVGGRYDGTWKEGRYDGFGTCIWEDGRQYHGEWKEGRAEGLGIEKDGTTGKIRHAGVWRDNEPVVPDAEPGSSSSF